MKRLFGILALSMILIGAGAPEAQYPFALRGRSLAAACSVDALRQAVVEYTSALLENPRDPAALRARALLYAKTGRYRAALHDADTASIYGVDEMYYYYLAGRTRPSIEYLRRAFRLACFRGDRPMISTIGALLLDYETKYPYATEEELLP